MMRDRCAWRGCEDPPSASSTSGYCPTHERASTIAIDRAAPAVLGPVRAQACKRCGFHVCDCEPSPTLRKARETYARTVERLQAMRGRADAAVAEQVRETVARAAIPADAFSEPPKRSGLCVIGRKDGGRMIPAKARIPASSTEWVNVTPQVDVDVVGLMIDDGGAGLALAFVQVGTMIVRGGCGGMPVPLAMLDGAGLPPSRCHAGTLVVIAVTNPTDKPADVTLCVRGDEVPRSMHELWSTRHQ